MAGLIQTFKTCFTGIVCYLSQTSYVSLQLTSGGCRGVQALLGYPDDGPDHPAAMELH